MSVASTRKRRYLVEPLSVDAAEAATLQAGMPGLQLSVHELPTTGLFQSLPFDAISKSKCSIAAAMIVAN
jgi:hypothetical protein